MRRPTDRLPPGKGVIRWREVLGLLAEKHYTGYLSYEAPNPEQWARSPYDVAREGVGDSRASFSKTPFPVTRCEANDERSVATTADPLFSGLNDRSITAIPRPWRSNAM